MRLRTGFIVLLALVWTVSVGGCGSDSDDAATTGNASDPVVTAPTGSAPSGTFTVPEVQPAQVVTTTMTLSDAAQATVAAASSIEASGGPPARITELAVRDGVKPEDLEDVGGGVWLGTNGRIYGTCDAIDAWVSGGEVQKHPSATGDGSCY